MDNKLGRNQGQLNRKNGGFSLIEVIVSIVILALISIPLFKYFSDSLQNSVRMAQRQQATVLAQQVTEMMKAEEQLIREGFTETGDSKGYQVPILTDAIQYDENDLNIGGLGLEMKTGFAADGTGEAEFVTPATGSNPYGYDIHVKVSTNVSANLVQRPLVYGLDDGSDVMAMETNQQTEALTYFMAANIEYSTSTGAAPLTPAKIAERIDRNIMISIQYDTTEKNYLVRVWYQYTTDASAGGNWISTSLASTLAAKPWTSSPLVEARMTSLSGIYLLYDKQGVAVKSDDDGETVTNVKNDHVNIIVDESTANQMNTDNIGVPDLYLICQNPTKNSSYELWVDWRTCHIQIVNITTDLDYKHHSNIKSTGDNPTGTLKRISPKDEKKDLKEIENELTGTGTPTRIVSIETEIYKMGTLAGGTINSDEALAVVKTTKGG